MRKATWIIIVVSTFYLCAASYMLGTLWAHRENMLELWEQQQSLNDTVSRAIGKLAATTKHNYDFSRTNKAFIQNVAELYVPDEVALLRRIPAKQ